MRKFPSIILTSLAALVVFHPSMYGAVTVLTVPWVPATPSAPHSAYIKQGGTEIPVTLQATVPSAVGSSDSFTVTWAFGDGSPNVTFALTNPYDVSTVHTYPAAAVGTAWTAVVTVNDTTNSTSGSANYYVTQQANTLAARANVAIDLGLWYLHQTMWRGTTTVGVNNVKWGGWDEYYAGGYICTNPATRASYPTWGESYDCYYDGSITAANIQAFEVSGHLGNGPATDPYTDDVSRGTNRMFSLLANQTNQSIGYKYNPAVVNYTCTNGVSTYPPSTSLPPGTYPYCGTGTQVFYEPTATSCLTGTPSTPCTVTPDENGNLQQVFANSSYGETIYTTGQFIDSLVAGANPTGTAVTGTAAGGGLPGILGETNNNVVQDMVDWYSACQWYDDYDIGNPASGYSGYTRGGGTSSAGGGWLYTCQAGDDNSTAQWGAIGLIGANRGFGISIPQVVKDTNNVWVTNSQDVQDPVPTGTDPYVAGDDYGSFGYRGSLYYSNAWGSFATTPSGMVQMALDGIGRTTNTKFGNASNASDQRYNAAETYYADNFCNATSNGAVQAPRAYTYGMFSFTKAMLLHNPSGIFTPIQYLRTSTPGVFPGNSVTGVPPGELDWYAAVSTANGGIDPCDGVAQTLVDLQTNPSTGTYDGHWYGNNYEDPQYRYETAWSIIMLNKTVFVSCINNLTGRGVPSGPGGAQITLEWSAQTNATGYNVLRSSNNGGPYTQIGQTGLTGYRDAGDGLLPNTTYYYVVQPTQSGTEICQSNQAAIPIP
jgi:hypothetical protein